jgi:hypothetical protein
MNQPFATVILKKKGIRLQNSDMLVKYAGVRLTVTLDKPVSDEYQSFQRVKRGFCQTSRKHQDYVTKSLDDLKTCVTLPYISQSYLW